MLLPVFIYYRVLLLFCSYGCTQQYSSLMQASVLVLKILIFFRSAVLNIIDSLIFVALKRFVKFVQVNKFLATTTSSIFQVSFIAGSSWFFHFSQREPLGISDSGFLWTECPLCQSTNSVIVLLKETKNTGPRRPYSLLSSFVYF